LTYGATLRLIAGLPERRPAACVPHGLRSLFKRLSHARGAQEALETEERIWLVWMAHPNAAATRVLDLASNDIAAQRHDIAETRLVRLLRVCPGYAEAWHKLGTLYYLLTRDAESMTCLHRALEIEPRHFGALAAAGEILLGEDEKEGAALAFHAALRLHPHFDTMRERLLALQMQN
jgi:tetratricopeptide (TPR) repeat protein